ncbi:MAG: ATP phosphoribosyltransferase regulatory subunit [Sphingomonadaceae bacterium]
MTQALLPEGFRDRLPPEAESCARLLRTVLDSVAAHGYRRVQPPLAEYEDSLAAWLDHPVGPALLRASDPLSGRSLALRPDITGQIARIAATRLADAPRPLRLCYGGAVLRARGTDIEPARERTQAGAELVGADSVAAVREVLGVAIEALEAAGVEDLSVDLTLPDLVEALARGPWPVADWRAVASALDGKDAGALAALGATRYAPLLEAAGPAAAALERLDALALPFPELLAHTRALAEAFLDRRVTIDPTERHGFEYQSWIGFSLFGAARGSRIRHEIGRGGAYRVRHPDGHSEAAVGFSLYIDPLAEAGLGSQAERRILLAPGTPPDEGARLRAQGWVTVAALDGSTTAEAMDCQASWRDGKIC